MENKEHIQRALGITADEYAVAVEQAGYQWIDRFFQNDQETVKIIASCAMFWKWWVNQWDIRDAEYIRMTSLDIIDTPLEGKYWQAAFEEWIEIHMVKKLQIIPNRMVIEELSRKIVEEENKLKTLKTHTHESN
jgi:hypothetical protein